MGGGDPLAHGEDRGQANVMDVRPPCSSTLPARTHTCPGFPDYESESSFTPFQLHVRRSVGQAPGAEQPKAQLFFPRDRSLATPPG